jgi:broad specificity phosphatase PhoE
MKTLEIRRHSIRSPLSDHLNQTGVTLARLVGQSLGPFDRVVTSMQPRAFETAIAMGFAVDEQNELMNTFGGVLANEAPWPQPFSNYAEVISQQGAAAKHAQKLKKFYTSILGFISEGRSALVINHGGVVELSVVGCLPDADYSTWGDSAEYCEGARLYWDDKFIRAEVLRVNT